MKDINRITSRPEAPARLSGWSIQIYDVTSSAVQETLVGLFAIVDSLAVEAVNDGAESFVVVACTEEEQAKSVYELVMAVDANAQLVTTSDPRSMLTPARVA